MDLALEGGAAPALHRPVIGKATWVAITRSSGRRWTLLVADEQLRDRLEIGGIVRVKESA